MIAEFLSETYSKVNIQEISLEYTKDTQALEIMLPEVVEIITDRKLRNRIDRLLKRLRNPTITDDSANDSTASNTDDWEE